LGQPKLLIKLVLRWWKKTDLITDSLVVIPALEQHQLMGPITCGIAFFTVLRQFFLNPIQEFYFFLNPYPGILIWQAWFVSQAPFLLSKSKLSI